MTGQQFSNDFSPAELIQRVQILESMLEEKEAVISEKEVIISTTNAELLKLSAELEVEKFKYDQLKRMIYGSKRERFISTDFPEQFKLELEPKALQIEQAVEQERETIRIEYERKKKRKPHPGRLALPSHLPVVETIIEPAEDTSGMIRIGQEVTDELDYTPATLQINRTIRPKYITSEDELGNQKQVIAPLDRPIYKCIASAALLSMIFTDKFVFHLPYYRIQQRISQMGVQLPTSTFESWVKLGSQHLKPLFAVHRMYVFSEIYQQLDESPIKVQDRDKPGVLHQGYMWVRYAPLSRSVLFEYFKGRSPGTPLENLSGFKGYLQTDGYAGYTYLSQTAGITHLSCWVHARRYFDKALANDREKAAHVLKLIQLLYAIEALAREANMNHEQRHALRLEKSLPVINDIGSYIYQNRDKVLPKSPIGVAFEYCANRWISLQNYLKDGMLEIDSNLIENSIRTLAIGYV